MTTPGGRQAQQNYQQQVRNTSATFRRDAAHADHVRHRRRRGPVSMVRRLFGLLFSLVFVAIVVVVLVVVLNLVQPDWFGHVTTWFDQLF